MPKENKIPLLCPICHHQGGELIEKQREGGLWENEHKGNRKCQKCGVWLERWGNPQLPLT